MIGVTLLALIVLCILVQENDRLKRKDKRLLYLTYMLIAASALAEWLGRLLDGKPEYPGWLLSGAGFIISILLAVTVLGFIFDLLPILLIVGVIMIAAKPA